jgi:phosphatidylglycerophosphatase C
MAEPAPDQPVRGSRIVAAFDFDGTITTSDSLQDFVLFVVGRGRFAAGMVAAAPWLAGLLTGSCDRGDAKAHFLAATLGGMTRNELEAAAQSFVTQRLPALVRAEMTARVREHAALGHQLVLVSASPALYLNLWAPGAGFQAVLATELEFRGDRFTGNLASPNCRSREKVVRLRQWFGSAPPDVLYAYGDSRGDREMLALADHAWLRGRDPLVPLS